jgi:hypothetical protein
MALPEVEGNDTSRAGDFDNIFLPIARPDLEEDGMYNAGGEPASGFTPGRNGNTPPRNSGIRLFLA